MKVELWTLEDAQRLCARLSPAQLSSVSGCLVELPALVGIADTDEAAEKTAQQRRAHERWEGWFNTIGTDLDPNFEKVPEDERFVIRLGREPKVFKPSKKSEKEWKKRWGLK